MSKGTTHRTVRIEDGLWEKSKTKAAEEGRNVSDAIRELLTAWIEGGDTWNQEKIRQSLEGHEPGGDFDGYVAHCECGWDGTEAPPWGDYRDHSARLIALKGAGDE